MLLTRITVLGAVAVAVGAATGDPIDPMNPATYGDLKGGVMQLDSKGVMRATGQSAEELAAEGKAPTKVFVPAFDEEESSTYNTNIAAVYQCDACAGIAFSMSDAFIKAEKLRGGTKGPKALPESEFFDIVERVCGADLVGKYGIKSRHGNAWDKVFSGPGLTEALALPDGQFGGGHWDARMKKMCEELVDDFSEEGIYGFHRSSSNTLKKGMCKKKCKVAKKAKEAKEAEHRAQAQAQAEAQAAAAAPSPPAQDKKAAAKKTKKGAAAKKAPAAAAGNSAELAALRAENAALKAQLAECSAKRATAEKSLEDMIEIMDK